MFVGLIVHVVADQSDAPFYSQKVGSISQVAHPDLIGARPFPRNLVNEGSSVVIDDPR